VWAINHLGEQVDDNGKGSMDSCAKDDWATVCSAMPVASEKQNYSVV